MFRSVGICILLAAITWMVFGQTLRHEFINHDDPEYVFDNPHVTHGLSVDGIRWAFTQSHSNNWHPITWMSHMLDCQLFGLNAGRHHLINVLLHTIVVLLLFGVLRQMTGSTWPSAFVAALFAIHPLRVESVAWIAERKDVLSGVFFVLTLAAYLRYVRKSSFSRYLTMSILFALGLMSKPMLVTLPCVLLLLDYWPLGRSLGWKRLILEKVPLFVLSAGSCVATLLAQKGAINSLARLPFTTRLGNAFVSCVVYLWQMVWPVRLGILYPHVENGVSIWIVLFAVALLGILTLAAFVLRKENPYVIVGWLWYLGMLAPVIGLVQVGSQAHADRYTYLPQIGLYILIAWATADLSSEWRYRGQVLGVAGGLILGVLAFCAWIQTSYWRNSESLWNHALTTISARGGGETGPDRILYGDIHYELGNALLLKGRLDEAIIHYGEALRLGSNYAAETCNNLAETLKREGRADEAIFYFQKALELRPEREEQAHYNLGNVLLGKGQVHEAIAEFRKALDSSLDHPEQVHYNLANALLQEGEVDEAIDHYQKAVEIRPGYGQAHNNLGNALLRRGRVDEAIMQYRRAINSMSDPKTIAETQVNLGSALLGKGAVDEAISWLRKAIDSRPVRAGDAHYHLANALSRKGQLDDAISEYEKAIELQPSIAEAHNNLGNALLSRNRGEEAVLHFKKAIEIRPDYAEAHYNLATAFLQAGQFDDAIVHYQAAVELRPDYPDAHNNLGSAFIRKGMVREGISQYEKALTNDAGSVSIQNNLAWVLATCSDPSLRNGARAVELAEQANRLSGDKNPFVVHTLAAAYAENGQFPKAVTTAEGALELADQQGNDALRDALEKELSLYRAGSPFHDQ